LQAWSPESRADRHVGSVATAADDDPTNPTSIVARVEYVPCTAQVDFHASGEIHWRVDRGNPNIAQVAGAIPCGYVQAAAKGNREVG
jgi:hypothetical protein